MENRPSQPINLPPPPGAIKTILAGFNAIANRPAVILFPALLDMFLWLGPRIKGDSLLAPLMATLPEMQSQLPAGYATFLTDFNNGLNLFSILRTFPLGIFSLMSGNIDVQSPLGLRYALGSPDPISAIGVIILLTILGWIGGSLYFYAVSRASVKPQAPAGIFRTSIQAILLSICWVIITSMTNLSLILILWMISLLGTILRLLAFLLLSLPVAWVLLLVYYSFFGIFIKAQNLLESIKSSFRMLRFGLPPIGWFTFLSLLISQMMDMLWRAAPANSWMSAVGIFGHAFISTGLLAASFIYYQELNTWIDSAFQWFNKQTKSSAQA